MRRQQYRGRHRSGHLPSSSFTISKRNLDINCNAAQGFGIYQNAFEEEVIPYVTSLNIACGAHAGDPLTMSKTIDTAKKYNIGIGALIGYNNLVSNGQHEMYLDVDELRALVLYQIGALHALVHSKGLEIRHVRAHGFLYKQLYTDVLIAETVAKAVSEFSRWLILVGLSSPVLTSACSNANIKMGKEVQITRRYRKDGTILPYNPKIDGGHFIQESTRKARELILTGYMTCEDKSRIKLNVDTIHIPSDTKESVELAKAIRGLIQEPKPLHLDRYDKYFADLASIK